MKLLSIVLTLFSVVGLTLATDLEDLHESCAEWASVGECSKNPGYMLSHCQLSCAGHEETLEDVEGTFYDIVETDSEGQAIHFDQFRGKVVYVINVASHCGYTAENYATFRSLKNYRSEGLEIVLAPCNSFGAQEPGDSVAIAQFAKKNAFEGIILSKDEVNGADTRPAFKYLKAVTGKSAINW